MICRAKKAASYIRVVGYSRRRKRGVGIVVKMAVSQFHNDSAGGGEAPCFVPTGSKSPPQERTHPQGV